jgi:hypothetical protein
VKIKELVKNEIRFLLKRKLILIILISFIMVVPYIAILNYDTPPEYDHYYYMEMEITPYNATPGIYGNGTFLIHSVNYKGFVVNKYLQPASNAEMIIRNITVNGNISQKVETNSAGVFDVNASYPYGVPLQCFDSESGFIRESRSFRTANSFQGVILFGITPINFKVLNISGSQSSKLYSSLNYPAHLASKTVNSSSITPGQTMITNSVSVSILPYYNLGLYGVAPVFFNGGNATASIYLKNGAYNQTLGTFIEVPNTRKEINITAGSVINPFKYSQILAMNEDGAISVSFRPGGTNFIPMNPEGNSLLFSSTIQIPDLFAYLLGTLAVSIIVLTTVNEIYSMPEREVYTSIPGRRRNTIFLKLFTGVVASLLSMGFAILISDIIGLVIFRTYVDLYVSITSIIIFFLFFLMLSPVYLLMESKKSLSSGTKSLIVLGFSVFVPIILSVGMELLYLSAMPASSLNGNINNFLTTPLLGDAGRVNLLFSVIPVSAPLQMMNYLIYNPFPSVTMYNHRSLFLLSPAIMIPDLVVWFVLLLWLAIKRYERN